ncbi:MAG TPA: type II toxin-antitoxin system VapC family toxin [Rhodopila sp.]|nr:type II toxin-antitoxin system VapC family toxin [Rhodopila sp.]
MRGYLLDTNVIAMTAPANAARDQTVLDWLEAHTDVLFLSVVTIAEIERGIALAACKDARRNAASLAAWLEAVLHLYGRRVLSMDIPVAQAAGRLDASARNLGLAPGFANIAMAATAVAHDLTVLTRNVRHFRPLGLTVLDPFNEPLP